MSKSSHTIGKLSIDFISTLQVIDPLKDCLYTQVSQWILPAIETVFEKHVFSDYHIRIGKMNLDLGTIIISNSSLKEVASRLESLLEEELIKLIQNGNYLKYQLPLKTGFPELTPQSLPLTPLVKYSGDSVMSERQFHTTQLFHYLLFGILMESTIYSPDYFLDEIIAYDHSIFLVFLKEHVHNTVLLKRLVWHFDIKMVEKILFLLKPSEQEFLSGFIIQIRNEHVFSKSEIGIRLRSSPQKYHRQIVEFSLIYFLNEKSVQFNRVEFVTDILMHLSNHYHIAFNDLLIQIKESLNSMLSGSHEKSELQEILSIILMRNSPGLNTGKRTGITFSHIAKSFIESINAGNSKKKATPLWDILYEKHRNDLRHLLFTYCISRNTVRNFVISLDSKRIEDCIGILNPHHCEYVSKFIAASEKFIGYEKSRDYIFSTSTVSYRNLIYEFIIHYHIGQKDGIFSEKDFTRAILISLANHHNLSFSFLLDTMLVFLKGIQSEDNQFKQLLNILTVLKKEHSCNKENTMHTSEIADVYKIVVLYENIQTFLIDGICANDKITIINEHTIENALQLLYENNPVLLDSLYLKLLPDKKVSSRIYSHHNSTVYESVNRWFVKTYGEKSAKALCLLNLCTNETGNSVSRQSNSAFTENDSKEMAGETPISTDIIGQLSGYDRTNNKTNQTHSVSDPVYCSIVNSKGNGEESNVLRGESIPNGNCNGGSPQSFQIITNRKKNLPFSADHDKIRAISGVVVQEEVYNLFFKRMMKSVVAEENGIHADRLLLENIILYSPDRLYNFFRENRHNCTIIDNIIKIISDRVFIRLLHILNSSYGIYIYNSFIIIRNHIDSNYTKDMAAEFTHKLGCHVLLWMLKGDINTDDKQKILSGIINETRMDLPEADREMFTQKLGDNLRLHNIDFQASGIQTLANEIHSNNEKNKNSITGQLPHPAAVVSDKNDLQNAKNILQSYNETSAENLIFEELSVANAGIVIGAAYFERLFTMLHYTEERKFKDDLCVQKAVKALYYFACNKTDCWEHELILNKLLCGIDITCPVDTSIALTQEERNTIDSLIQAIIKNWPALKNTSPSGLRESFLQRSGSLIKNNDERLLQVDKKSFDMLIDTVPWGFSMIKFPWMKSLLRVEWKWV